MDPLKFRGYAQSDGFDPIKVPDTVSRIANEGQNVLRGMRDNANQEVQVRNQFQQGLERKFNVESANRQQVFDFERSSRMLAQKDVERNQQTKLQNLQTSNQGLTEQQFAQVTALSGLSKALTSLVVDQVKRKQEEQVLIGKNVVFESNVPIDVLQRYKEAKNQLKKADTSVQLIANKLEFEGYSIETLERLRSLSGKAWYGAAAAYAQMGADNYPMFRAQVSDVPIPYQGGEITLGTAKSKDEWEFANTYVRTQFIKQYQGINDALLDEHLFPRMRSAEQTERVAYSEGIIKSKKAAYKDSQLEELRTNLKGSSNAGQTILETIKNKAGYNEETGAGAEFLGAKRDEVFGNLVELAKAGEFKGPQLDELLKFQYRHNDGSIRTFGESFKLQLQTLVDAVNQKDKQDYQNREFAYTQAGEQLEELFLKKVETEGFTEEEKAQAIEKYSQVTHGRTSQVLSGLITIEKKQDALARTELTHKSLYGLVTSKELSIPGKYSDAIRKEFEAAAKDGDSLATLDKGQVQGALSFLYMRNRELLNQQGTPNESSALLWAKPKIEAIFRSKVLEERAKGNINGAIDVAQTYVLNLLNDGKVKGTGPFAMTGDFSSLSPYLGMGKGSSNVAQVNRVTDISKKLITQPNYLETNGILNDGELKQLENFRDGRSSSLPPIISALAAKSRTKSAVDIINAQLQAYKKPLITLKVPDQLLNGMSPLQQQIMNYRPSNANTYQAFGMSGGDDPYRPLLDLIASHESTSYGGYDAMNEGGDDGGRTAIKSANSVNVFGIGLTKMTVAQVLQLQSDKKVFASGRYQIIPKTLQSLMQNKYGFTGVNVNDKYDAKTQDKLAIALLRGRAGKFFSGSGNLGEAVVGLGNEWRGLQKPSIQKTIAQRLVAVKAVLDSPSPFRQPESLRAGVVYRIGNRGYGSTGPHLDVKPVARGTMTTDGGLPRIKQGDLDPYVSVNVKGSWKPLSQGTVTTDNDQLHRNRGSFGHDFAAPDGTQVSLKNGARVVGSFKGDGGTDHLIIELPDGRRYQFLHGTNA
jgi:hypothetical protein